MCNKSNRILIVDDDSQVRAYLGKVARKLDFEVNTIGSAEDFADALQDFKPTVLILDLNMPGSDGIQLLRYLAAQDSEVRVLLISGEDSRVLNAAERLGSSKGLNIAGALQKPVMLADLEVILKRQMRQTITPGDLMMAIKTGKLLLHYQPKLSHDGDGVWAIAGAEALVRWRHPELGVLMPADFISIAEEAGLIGDLTDVVLRETVEQNALWAEQGLDTNIAVNIPPQLLTDVDFPDRLSLLMREYGIDGSKLTLEITETAAMKNVETTMDILARLRLKGVQLSVDDFGTGYSSLKQLFHMPFNELKIDRSFVLEIPNSQEAKTIVKSMIQLADNLNLGACAEGVETQEVLDYLESVGCRTIQGYFICEPVTATAFANFVQAWFEDGAQRLIGLGRN